MTRNTLEKSIGLYVAGLAGIAITLLAIVGWGSNVISFTQCDFDSPYQCEIVRGVGIVVAPVGAIAGYIDIGPEENK